MSKIKIKKSRLISPHGGSLVQQYNNKISIENLKKLPIIDVDENIQSDIIQIATGTYSPVKRFMNFNEMNCVLNNNILANGISWTVPIILQIQKKIKESLPEKGLIAIANEVNNQIIAVINVENIEKLTNIEKIIDKWFLTQSNNHPGVSMIKQRGDYIISGKPFLIKSDMLDKIIGLTPKLVRKLMHNNNWENVIGFHTRNIPHRGHEYIQLKALTENNADAILISPISGEKKAGDFSSEIVLDLYTQLMDMGYYEPYGSLLCPLQTYSRFSGPREAVFTALCRKNYGCNYFIVGRDHTGVGKYYDIAHSQKFIANIDLDMTILTFDSVYYSPEHDMVTDDLKNIKSIKELVNISGSIIRKSIREGSKLPNNIVRKQFLEHCMKKYINDQTSVFV